MTGIVAPAKAGAQVLRGWIPACAGMTGVTCHLSPVTRHLINTVTAANRKPRNIAIMIFHSRHTAVQQLLPLLEVHRRHPGVVVALPRGGVPMAKEIAAHLEWPMHVLSVKKLPHPDNVEYAIGAVGANELIVDEAHKDVDPVYIEAEVKRIRALIARRDASYRQPTLDVSGKTVIIVDDGIATGLTVRCAIKILRSGKPRSIIVAVPVAAAEAVRELHPLVDEFVVLHVPVSFGAVGQWYEDFREVSDEEVARVVMSVSRHGMPAQPIGRARLSR